ncbi:hypothetical protein [Clostridium hydrogenum]|uniref:hypothetical protein n=1 Tax=Clostridium hydrogenum TaxID=2855764 RepID=UPI001F3C8D3E|nr:hypothetical protein [Clostridium hydrogenum]
MNIKNLENSIKKVIDILENQYANQLNNGILELIYKRYKNALICLNNNDLKTIKIAGGVRAYLDSYSDYTCPLVMAMDEAETIYDEVLKDI